MIAAPRMPNSSQAFASSSAKSPACSRLCDSTVSASASALAFSAWAVRRAARPTTDDTATPRGRTDDREGVLAAGDRERAQRRGEEEVEAKPLTKAEHDGGPRPPTMAVATTSAMNSIASVGSPWKSGVTSSSAASSERPEDAEGIAVQATTPAQLGRRPHVALRAPRLVVRDDVDVDVARLGDDDLADAGVGERRQPAAPARADQDLRRVLGPREVEDRGRGVVADDGVERAAHVLGHGVQPVQPVGIHLHEPVAAGDVERQPLAAAGARRDARRSAQQHLRLRAARDGDDDALAGGPGGVDVVLVAVALETLVDPVGQPQQGQLAQRREVALAEELRQRRVDLVGGVDVAVRHAPTQRLRAHVDQLDRVGLAHDLVGDGLALADAGDRLDDVVERLQVLDVDRRDDADAGVEQVLDVLPALLVGGARHVGVGQLVDQHDLGRPGQDARTSISSCDVPRWSIAPPRDDLEVPDLLGGVHPAVGLDEADDDVGAPRGPPPPLVEHRERLADAGRGAEVDPQDALAASSRTPRPQCAPAPDLGSSARLSSSTLTFGSPRKPSWRPSVWSATSARTAATGSPRSRATRSTCSAAYAGEMYGSRPEPDAVTASAGTRRRRRPRLRRSSPGAP